MTKEHPSAPQGSLFDSQLPEHADYPMNRGGEEVVWNVIRRDIAESDTYLIITGYSSLAFLAEQLGSRLQARSRIEIVLGNEPVSPLRPDGLSGSPGMVNLGTGDPGTGSFGSVNHKSAGHRSDRHSSGADRYAAELRTKDGSSGLSLPDQIRQYWLQRGISVLLNGPVLRLIEKIRFELVAFLYRPNLHAKIYRGDLHAMLGSSNFTRPGMLTQGEANVRRSWGTEGYNDISDIADHFRHGATPWNDAVIELLESLLRNVSWQESLARAIAMINEGQWIEEYPNRWLRRNIASLWPTQKRSIAQALYLLERQGSVLIADPTGSGKTRMGARLLESLLNRLWSRSAWFRANYQIICPPLVIDTWNKELGYLPQSMSGPVSHGILSSSDGDKAREVLQQIRQANILLVDEAHNYLNKASTRSRSIVVNRADHVILFTATPLNRRSEDLLRLVEILGLDNLSDEAYRTYRQLMTSRDARSPEKMEQLRNYVHRFMVRRTKRELNEAIDEEPEAYRDEFGNLCRYPVHRSKIYKTGETTDDVELAGRIERLIDRLRGIIYLSRLKADKYDLFNKERQQSFLKKRLTMGPALTRYNIRNMLRSSRAALIEHLEGTDAARETFGVRDFKRNPTGDIIGRIRELRKNPPDTNLDIPLPDWISDRDRWQQACDEEVEALEEIAELARRISGSRETDKAKMVARLIEKEGMVLAYDTALITLQVIRQKLKDLGYDEQTMVVTGSSDDTRKQLKKAFALEAENRPMVALCSDALAEGINLQRASAVVFLDMPTVIRVAEQRIGRVDRLDSPHPEITVYWPDDSEAFRLKTDRQFFHRHQMVEELIGSNINLPEQMAVRGETFAEETLSTDEVIAEFEEHRQAERSWEGFEDAFTSMRNMVFGPEPLIERTLYDEAVRHGDSAGAWISVVRTNEPFVFAAVRGSESTAPWWILRTEKADTDSRTENGGKSQVKEAGTGRPEVGDDHTQEGETDAGRGSSAGRSDERDSGYKSGSSASDSDSSSDSDSARGGASDRSSGSSRGRGSEIHKDIHKITEKLRKLLPESEPAEFDRHAEALMQRHMAWLDRYEQQTLPNKKRHAIEQMRYLLPKWKKMEDHGSREWHQYVHRLHDLVMHREDRRAAGSSGKSSPGVDWYELANRWLDVAQPELIRWIETERKNRKYQNIRLKNINRYLHKNPLDEDALAHVLDGLPVIEPVDRRVMSMIIGVTSSG